MSGHMVNLGQFFHNVRHHSSTSFPPFTQRHHDGVPIVGVVIVILNVKVVDIVIVGIVVIVIVVVVVIHIGNNVGGHAASR